MYEDELLLLEVDVAKQAANPQASREQN